MSEIEIRGAFMVVAAHTLRSATGPEEELVALDALSKVASALSLAGDSQRLHEAAHAIRRADSMKKDLRAAFEGQMDLNFDGKDGQ
jgi:hypothetical protein